MESSGDRLEGTKGQTRQCTASDHSNDTSASKEAHGMRRKRQVKGSKTTFKINLLRLICCCFRFGIGMMKSITGTLNLSSFSSLYCDDIVRCGWHWLYGKRYC